MKAVEYVAKRMLLEVCDIAMVRESNLDSVYNHLYDSFERYLRDNRFRETLILAVPPLKHSEKELLADVHLLYGGILRGSENHHNISTIRCLFTVSLYIMGLYKNNLPLCSLIPVYFHLISERLGGWSYFRL